MSNEKRLSFEVIDYIRRVSKREFVNEAGGEEDKKIDPGLARTIPKTGFSTVSTETKFTRKLTSSAEDCD